MGKSVPAFSTKQQQQRGYQQLLSTEQDGTKDVESALRVDHVQPSYLQALHILAASAAWLACSSAIILVNRYLMVDLDFAYPMAVSALGMTCSALFAFIICDILHAVPSVVKQPLDATFYLFHIFPVGLIQAVCLYLSNQLYMLLTIAFIEMSKATLPVFTMAALYMTGLEAPTRQLTGAVVFTALGCLVAAYGEVRLSTIGVICTLSSLTMESGRLVMTQFLLVGCSFHPLQGLKYIAPACVVCLGLGSRFAEWPHMVKSGAWDIAVANWPAFLLSASLGVVVNLLGLLIIKLASATTLKVLAAVRGPIIVMAGMFVFLEQVTGLQFVGYSIALVGFVWYNFAKARQVTCKPPAEVAVLSEGERLVASQRSSSGSLHK